MFRSTTCVAGLALLCSVQVAWAQVTYDAPASYGYSYNSIDMDLTWDGQPVVPTATTTADGFTLTYDATALPTYPAPDPAGPVEWVLEGLQSFRVGPLPVEASMDLHLNGKLVNGGGDASRPTTSLTWSRSLYYDLDDDNMLGPGDVPVGPFCETYITEVVGNGLRVLDNTHTMSHTFILAPEHNYLMRYHQVLSIADLPTVPMSSTFEAGGETAYSGITMTLTATPVPEPSTLALLAVAIVGLGMRWWRRNHAGCRRACP